MPHADPRSVLLRHAEVDVDRIERLQANQRISGREVLPEIHLPDAEQAGERRADRLPVDCRANLADTRVGLARLGRRAIELRL